MRAAGGRGVRLLVAAVALSVLTACGTRVKTTDTAAPGPRTADPAAALVDAPPAAVTPDDPAGPDGPAPATTPSNHGGPARTRPVAGGTAGSTGPGAATGEVGPSTGGVPTPGAGAGSQPGAPRRPTTPTTAGGSEPKSTVVIGTVGTLSGPVGAALIPMVRAVQAWVRLANERGLANGHPVEYVVADDGGDPARNKALAQELVERRKVLAMVAMAGVITGEASFEYLNKVGVPVIGSDTGGDYFYKSPTFFPQAPHGYGLYQASAAGVFEPLPRGTKLAFMICVEASVCDQTDAYWPKIAQQYGLPIVYKARISLVQPDFTAECLNARQAGAEAVMVNLEGNGIQRLAASCARQGYRPKIMYSAVATTPDQPKDPNLAGAGIASNMPPWFLDNTPGLAQFHAVLRQYTPGLTPTGTTVAGWISARLFQRAVAKLPEPPTREAILDGLYAVKDDDLDGLTYPLTFTRGQPAPRVVCWWRITIADSMFTSPDGGVRHCGDVIAP